MEALLEEFDQKESEIVKKIVNNVGKRKEDATKEEIEEYYANIMKAMHEDKKEGDTTRSGHRNRYRSREETDRAKKRHKEEQKRTKDWKEAGLYYKMYYKMYYSKYRQARTTEANTNTTDTRKAAASEVYSRSMRKT
eukprot:6408158-Amphidinium_carterae.6